MPEDHFGFRGSHPASCTACAGESVSKDVHCQLTRAGRTVPLKIRTQLLLEASVRIFFSKILELNIHGAILTLLN